VPEKSKCDCPAITVFTRHSEDCPKAADRYWKRCQCRKSLYIYEGGKTTFVTAKTRSWEQAERVAQVERDRRDPVKRRLLEIEAEEVQKASLQKAKNITVKDATERWLKSLPTETHETEVIRNRTAWRIREWAADQNPVILNVREITPDMLDLWRGTWSLDANEKYSRIGQTSASQFQGRLKNFFWWCVATENLSRDPSALLQSIPMSKDQTQPLTPTQFEELLLAIAPFIESAIGETQDFGKELKALFLLQRWAGLRILDCLMLPRMGLVGNRLSLITKKTGAKIEDRVLPDHVVVALQELSPDRPFFLPAYFFWTKGQKWEGLSAKWGKIIRELNRSLDFKEEEGQPMRFHSHMLRDTYAVELLKAGVPLEDVSKLLTHTSILTTERHYAPWVRSRLKQLEDKSVAAMRSMGATVSERGAP
jgi:integrase